MEKIIIREEKRREEKRREEKRREENVLIYNDILKIKNYKQYTIINCILLFYFFNNFIYEIYNLNNKTYAISKNIKYFTKTIFVINIFGEVNG